MLNLVKIAITGGVASGKSTVCRYFQELGAFTISADAIVHELLTPESALGQKIIQLFGSEILQNGKIDRTVLAEVVFNDPKRLDQLEKLLHPMVLQKIEQTYSSARATGNYTAFVVEIPLLFEIGNESFYDYVITVTSDPQKCIERLKKMGKEASYYQKRMQRQIDPDVKAAKSHFVIKNNSSTEELKKQVQTIYRTINLR